MRWRRQQNASKISSFCLVLAALAFMSTSLITLMIMNYKYGNVKRYSYRGSDFPQEWDLPPLEKVHMALEDNHVHFSLNTSLGIAQWESTLPSGRGVIHLGKDLAPFGVSMFHQIRCLNIIREGLVAFRDSQKRTKPTPLVGHCMNYLRQMVLCRSDLRLESGRSPVGPKVVVSDVTHTCKDWSAVYDAAEENYRQFIKKKKW